MQLDYYLTVRQNVGYNILPALLSTVGSVSWRWRIAVDILLLDCGVFHRQLQLTVRLI